MEWVEYRDLCDTPNVFSRWALEQTKRQVEPELQEVFDQVLASRPLEKPTDHRGDERTDMFVLELGGSAIGDVIRCL